MYLCAHSPFRTFMGVLNSESLETTLILLLQTPYPYPATRTSSLRFRQTVANQHQLLVPMQRHLSRSTLPPPPTKPPQSWRQSKPRSRCRPRRTHCRYGIHSLQLTLQPLLRQVRKKPPKKRLGRWTELELLQNQEKRRRRRRLQRKGRMGYRQMVLSSLSLCLMLELY